MSRRFPPAVPGLLQALTWIQSQAATGALAPAGGGPDRIWFRDGMVLAAGDGNAAPDGGPDLREMSHALLEGWAGGDALALFTEDEAPARPHQGAGRLNAGDLIVDLVRRSAALHWIEQRLGGADGKVRNPERLPGVLPRESMSPTEAFLLSRADGTLTLQEILQVSPLEPSEVRRALYALVASGLLEVDGALLPGDRREAPSAGPSPDAALPGAEATVPVRTPSEATAGEQPPGPADTAPAGEQAPEPADTDPVPVVKSAEPAPVPSARAVSALDDFLARTAAPPEAPQPQPSRPDGSAAGPPAAPAPPAETGTTYARSPEMEKLRAEVLEWIGRSAGRDHYGVLGVSSTADESEIRRAYYRLAKKFHPDKFRRPEFEGLVQDVEKMFAATTEAYNTLTDDRARAEYEAEQAARKAKGGRSKEADLTAQARESYLRAKKHVEAEEYFDAASLLETACRLDGSKPEYWLMLGSVQEKNPKWRRKAEASYLKAVEINPTSADAYLHLARLYQAGGLARRAVEMYKKVVEWDPLNEEAQAGISGKGTGEASGVGGKIRSIFKGSRS